MPRRHKKNPVIPLAPERRGFSLWGSIKWLLIVGVGVYASYLGVLQFWAPNLVVAPSLEVDLEKPIATRFSVTNNNPVLNVTFTRSLGVHHVAGANFRFGTYKPPGARDDMEPPQLSSAHPAVTLHPNEAETIDFEAENELLKEAHPIDSADIVIIIRYQVSWLPFESARHYRFVTQKGSDGKPHWVPKAQRDIHRS